MTRVLLAKYGAIIDSSAIAGHAILPKLSTASSVVREISAAGINYQNEESINIVLRIYLQDSTAISILKSLGVDVQHVDSAYEWLAEKQAEAEAEEEKPVARGKFGKKLPSRKKEDEDDEEVTSKTETTSPYEVKTSYLRQFYVEYVLTQVNLETGAPLPIQMHPRYQAIAANPKFAETLEKRFANFTIAVNKLATQLSFEPDIETEEDDVFGGQRLSTAGMSAQAEAHRLEQDKFRNYVDSTFNFFDQKVLGDATEEDITFETLISSYTTLSDSDGPLFTVERILRDVSKDIIELEAGE